MRTTLRYGLEAVEAEEAEVGAAPHVDLQGEVA